MRNPSAKVMLYLLLTMLGVALGLYGFRAESRVGEAWASTGPRLAGVVITPIAFILLVRAWFYTRGRAKLLAGRGVVARWHVGADEWERFKAFDRKRGQEDPALANDLSLSPERQHAGIDVIVGKTSAMIGDHYQVLRKGGIPTLTGIHWLADPANPECLEFLITYYRHRSLPRHMAFRFPFPAMARGEAERVYRHFEPMLRPRPSLALRNPKVAIAIALSLALLSGAVAAWGVAGDLQELEPLMAAIFGSMIAVSALLMALMIAKMAPKTG